MFSRLIGVLTVRNGILVKSYGYRSWRPAGGLRTALLNLDRWGADEILVLDISRQAAPDAQILRDLKEAPISTPITYGGGIRTVAHVEQALDAGADRILIESLLWSSPSEVQRISEVVGAQALVASLPIRSASGHHRVWSDPEREGLRPSSVNRWAKMLADSPLEEVLVVDVAAEGTPGQFSVEMAMSVSTQLLETGLPIIWFGGIDTSKGSVLLDMNQTAGIGFGNALHEKELAISEIRRQLIRGRPEAIRPAHEGHA